MIDYKALGLRIKKLRLENNLTQKELSNKINVSIRYISMIEIGKGKSSMQTIVDIVNILGTSLDNIFCDSLKNVSINSVVDSKTIYNKEVKELLEDLDHDELKLIIEMIKYNKDSIRKAQTIERIDKQDKKRNR